MRIYLHIGLEHAGAERLQKLLIKKRDKLQRNGVLFPRAPGASNHTRLFMAVTDPEHIDPLRYNRGYISEGKQAKLYRELSEELQQEVAQAKPDVMILSASQLGAKLHRKSELERLKALLSPHSHDIIPVAHIDEPAHALAWNYSSQILEGRDRTLSQELSLVGAENWWQDCLNTLPRIAPQAGQFEETQGAPFWLDYSALEQHWNAVFGAGALRFRPYHEATFYGDGLPLEVQKTFDLSVPLGKIPNGQPPALPSAVWLARCRHLNQLLLQLLSTRRFILPRQLWRSFHKEIFRPGAGFDPKMLQPIAAYFLPANTALAQRHPALAGSDRLLDHGLGDTPLPLSEPDLESGFRASQYLMTFMQRIKKASRGEMKSKGADLGIGKSNLQAEERATPPPPGKDVSKLLPPAAVQNYETLINSALRPHNNLGAGGEDQPRPDYSAIPSRVLPKGSSGNVIVGCMKNEAPYILEWVAYHRAMGVDNFLIYTNGCEDGTSELLDRLQELGILQHRNNDNWKGNSPQQYALNQSLKEPLIKNADWIIHIDVDEFINVRCGNGTLQDFLARVPDATNIAMTWRLFGHNGVTRLADRFVIEQFDTCAPKHCPKPHTVWGYKTMSKNIGAYQKISCHRPNKLLEEKRAEVKWVNGSGKDMTQEAVDNGWRSSRKSIGYDLLQLNHYALRSAESYLVKRQRGRALHVDRSIGINYWIRMDWGDHKDLTILRNLPRMRTEFERLLEDASLKKWHKAGLDWHLAKAAELHGMDEFESLYQKALTIKLNAAERTAYALALDVES
ncbi:hypothetical protein RSK20926_16577 [Roseobacter sp. SK209-2-6]|uniref:glycosyltransferase family 2 protein n=1 Tax=Roseobacter sp. SK209-2-6 TaxID=388739 RepID=UPI0000F3CF67|nr:glycosyltransferase family 2 protein [Roseobacter sp. SK209-2-6]EBA15290.1 hypothetical protein RSK20926_16577 [Roseobacter sp. SK209-2-6]